jgi:hypothetical protein
VSIIVSFLSYNDHCILFKLQEFQLYITDTLFYGSIVEIARSSSQPSRTASRRKHQKFYKGMSYYVSFMIRYLSFIYLGWLWVMWRWEGDEVVTNILTKL